MMTRLGLIPMRIAIPFDIHYIKPEIITVVSSGTFAGILILFPSPTIHLHG